MPHGSITETLPAPSDAVFPLLHDYSRRLQWDTLLKTPASPTTSPTPSPTSLCTGRWYLGSLALKTRYIVFAGDQHQHWPPPAMWRHTSR